MVKCSENIGSEIFLPLACSDLNFLDIPIYNGTTTLPNLAFSYIGFCVISLNGFLFHNSETVVKCREIFFLQKKRGRSCWDQTMTTTLIDLSIFLFVFQAWCPLCIQAKNALDSVGGIYTEFKLEDEAHEQTVEGNIEDWHAAEADMGGGILQSTRQKKARQSVTCS